MSAAFACAFARLVRQANAAAIFILMMAAIGALGDDLEKKMLPVLGSQVAEPLPATPGQLCWRYSFDKKRVAQPMAFNWTMIVDDARFSVVPRIADNGANGAFRIRELPPGEATRLFCVVAPIRQEPLPIIITGEAIYRTHGLWSLRQPLATVTFP